MTFYAVIDTILNKKNGRQNRPVQVSVPGGFFME